MGDPSYFLPGGISWIQCTNVAVGWIFTKRLLRPAFVVAKRRPICLCIARRTAETILIETGLDMSRFPTAKHFARWAGLAPGNNESAGKRSSGRTTKGNPTLKSTLIQSAKVAARKKNSFF